ncbi:MAG: type IX secretion system sortase PorU [Bacteroidales bacterium]|nr:type IX secretion system sortase PorU [Bacteroidales bacterium]
MLRKTCLQLLFFLLPALLFASLPHKKASVLATGHWYKIAVTQSGIHKISASDLELMGIDLTTLVPSKIRLFGNGAGMLPESNALARIDDLKENAILVNDGGDGHFGPEDYILFYGESPDKWTYNNVTHIFTHQKNIYSDSTFYFLNVDTGDGKRIQPVTPASGSVNSYSRRFDDYQLHELDLRNLIKSGKEWFGEQFDNVDNTLEIPFCFPNIDSMSSMRIRTYVASKSSSASYFFLFSNGQRIDSMKVEATDPGDNTRYCKSKLKQTWVLKPASTQLLTLSYSPPDASSLGWLNYIELSCARNLIWVGPQLSFRDANSIGTGKITEFIIQKATPSITIWDVTDPSEVGSVTGTLTDSTLKFKLSTDSLRQFIGFDGTSYYPITFSGEVPNQNLHADESSTLVIVTHPLFRNQADQLAEFHRAHNGITVKVVETQMIYNEFASGNPDVSSIRDFMKLLYDESSIANRPKYLLLFGDGSYDPKNRIPGNNNFVPTFQSLESLSPTSSYVSDDFFGILGETGGYECNGAIDIGIGRFPVSTVDEAQIMVNKIIHYSEMVSPVTGDWRNTFTFVADDENLNLHLHQAEEVTAIVASKYPLFNVNKIYFDAYKRVAIPGGSRYPDANKALNEAISKGSLIVNYTGHGGETGWSFEQVLTMADIEAWSNYNKLPVFVTATCEFSRFDNPERYTAGETVILHPNGGAIALYSTTRLAFAGQNIKLDTSFFKHLMDRDEQGNYIKMGDLIRLSKNFNDNNFLLRNFILLGDPAQSIAFSDYSVKTISINNEALNQPDTVRGLSHLTVLGEIEDDQGQKVTSFNGKLNATVFDKPRTYVTLGSLYNQPTPENYPEPFKAQNSILFKGDVSVTNGGFQFSCVLPKDVSLEFGKGKLSYYAFNEQASAAGYSDKIIIGGTDPSINPETTGPDIHLYLDKRSFVSGEKTSQTPVLLADLFDTNGINYFGLGIGHEIEMVLDDDRAHSQVLNDYFSPDCNSYSRGSITYSLNGVTKGTHRLSLKAWDMYNNASEREITFYVSNQSDLSVQQVMNVPNPLFNDTWFVFNPSSTLSGSLNVTITIFNITGQQVKTITDNFPDNITDGFRIYWDGTDENGKKLSSGIYPYHIIFKDSNGGLIKISQKLVII